jgi:O-antigen/teichoic acid export membrane protein
VGGALCADELIALIFGDQFEEAGTILRILVVVMPFEFLSIPAANALGAIHQQNRVLWISCGGAAVNLLLAFALIPSLGGVGCAWAGAATTVFCCVAYLMLLSRHCRLWVDLRAYAKLIVANALMGLAVYSTLPYGVLVAVPVGGVVYAVVALGLRAVSVKMLKDVFRPADLEQVGERE